MALQVEIIPFNVTAGSTQVVNHIVYPLATARGIIFMSTHPTNQMTMGYGFDDGTSHVGVGISGGDIGFFAHGTARMFYGDYSIQCVHSQVFFGGAAPVLRGYVSALNPGSFTITYDINTMTGAQWYAVVFSGSNVRCKAGWTYGGDIPKTVDIGFDPACMLFCNSYNNTTTSFQEVSGATLQLGVGVPCDGQGFLCVPSAGNSTANFRSAQISGAIGGKLGATADIGSAPGDLRYASDWPLDGVRLTGSAHIGFNDSNLGYLAIGGSDVSANVVNVIQPTGGTGKVNTALKMTTPRAALFASCNSLSQVGAQPSFRMSLGFYDGRTNVGLWGGMTQGAAYPFKDARLESTTTPIVMATATGPNAYTVDASATCTLTTRNLATNWGVHDAEPRELWVLVLGDGDPRGPCGGVTQCEDEGVLPECHNNTNLNVWSNIALPDAPSYFGGFKAPLVTEFNPVRSALSDINGQYQGSTASWMMFDRDFRVRQMLADPDAKYFYNRPVVLRTIEDADRRAELTPRTIFRGILMNYKPEPEGKFSFEAQDWFFKYFQVGVDEQDQIPRRRVSEADFPNCGKKQVTCSAERWVVDGSYSIADPDNPGQTLSIDSINIRGGVGHFISGQVITILGIDYTVSEYQIDNTIKFSPSLQSDVPDGEGILPRECFDIDPSIRKAVPIIYGLISDTFIDNGIDNGDGQGPLMYVGDRVMPDGNTWGEFLWAGHACYSPNGKPFQMYYWWNHPLAPGGVTNFYIDEAALHVDDLAEEAGIGGRILMPGYAGWDSMGYKHSYVQYGNGEAGDSVNGCNRYTVIFLRDIFRDWALGILEAPRNVGEGTDALKGGCVNGYGIDDVGDGTGSLITRLPMQFYHCLVNWVLGNYKSGPWLTCPTFDDAPSIPVLDADSFNKAYQTSVARCGGYEGHFIIGYADERISMRDLIARFCQSCDVDFGFNYRTQGIICMFDPADEATAVSLTQQSDIVKGSFSVEDDIATMSNAIPYTHTQDFIGRSEERNGWRVSTTFKDNTSITNYCITKVAQTLNLYMLRGKNRSTDSDEYTQGTATINDVIAHRMIRSSDPPRVVHWTTGWRGLNSQPGDLVKITHTDGVGAVDGYVGTPVRITIREYDPGKFLCAFTGYDMTRFFS